TTDPGKRCSRGVSAAGGANGCFWRLRRPGWGPFPMPGRNVSSMSIRFVIVGGGPGGNTAATVAARLGAEVTLIERDLVGGAAHLWDCVPSKAMIATGGFLSELHRAEVMGLAAQGRLDLDALRARIARIEERLHHSICD